MTRVLGFYVLRKTMTDGEEGGKEETVDAEQDGRDAVKKMEESEVGGRRSKGSLEDEEEVLVGK